MDVSTDGSLSSFLNPSLFCFAPTSLGSCKAAESHLGRVTCPQHGRDKHPLGNALITVRQAGQEHPAVAGLVAREPGWPWPAASLLQAAGAVSEAPGWVVQRGSLGELLAVPQRAGAAREAAAQAALTHRRLGPRKDGKTLKCRAPSHGGEQSQAR